MLTDRNQTLKISYWWFEKKNTKAGRRNMRRASPTYRVVFVSKESRLLWEDERLNALLKCTDEVLDIAVQCCWGYLIHFFIFFALPNNIKSQDMQTFMFKGTAPANLIRCQLRYNIALLKKDFLLSSWKATRKTISKVNERGKWAKLNYDNGKLKDHGKLLGTGHQEEFFSSIPIVSIHMLVRKLH
jgi:hypothetical protein